jgi:transcriptional regulator with XRE-family HTH domain
MTRISRQELGKRLQRAREIAGLSVEQSAAKIGVGSDELQAWEAGTQEPLFEDAFRAAEAYGVTIDTLGAA